MLKLVRRDVVAGTPSNLRQSLRVMLRCPPKAGPEARSNVDIKPYCISSISFPNGDER